MATMRSAPASAAPPIMATAEEARHSLPDTQAPAGGSSTIPAVRAETAVAFFVSMVSALLEKPVLEQTVVLGEMSVQGMLLKVKGLPERMQLAVEAGAKRILIPSENKRDVAEVPDAVLTKIQWQFYDSPIRALIMALGLN